MAGGANAQDSLRAVEKKIQAAWEQVSTLVASVKMESHLPVGEDDVVAQGEGQLEYLKAEPKAKYRQQMKISIPPPLSMEAGFEFLFDGEALYLMNEVMGQMTIAKADAPDLEKGALPPGGGPLLDALKSEMQLSVLPEMDVDGRSAYVLEGKRRRGDPHDPVQRAVFYIDKENGIQRRVEFFSADGALNTRIDYSGFKLNIPIDAQRFVYTGPQPPEESGDDSNVPEPTPAPEVKVP
ncbi:MAG: hypothetical protein HYV26_21285 [Candidatus Hydrogenedentes bacterium]|nr:hypothetical protein [Candidatus Hydrogenedentota bacterium]